MTRTQLLAVVCSIVFVGVGGNIALLVQEARGRIRTRGWNTRLLRWLSLLSAALVVGTAVVARPWYWDLALGAVAILGSWVVMLLLRLLWHPPAPSIGRALLFSSGAVLLGAALLGLAGVAGVLDGAALSSPAPVLQYHGGQVLRSPVLYQIFWGAQWEVPGTPGRSQAVEFQNVLAGSKWAHDIAAAGYGIEEFRRGGCWVDDSAAPGGAVVAGTASGAFPGELRAVFSHKHTVHTCPDSPEVPVPQVLPSGAVVALWLPPTVDFEINGVAAHGWIPWPGLSPGLVVAGLPGAYARWSSPSCARISVCAALPSYATASYALSHELLEAATNPYGNGWYAAAPLSWTARYVLSNGPPSLLGLGTPPTFPGEVADLCEPGTATSRNVGAGTLDPHHPLPVAPFYRPGPGCTSG